ncbi:hypothetical protein [Serratia fonticola]
MNRRNLLKSLLIFIGANVLASNKSKSAESNEGKIKFRLDSVNELTNHKNYIDGDIIKLQHLHPGKKNGGGLFIYTTKLSRNNHDGGRIIDPTQKYNGNLFDYLTPANTDSSEKGVLARYGEEPIKLSDYGADTGQEYSAVQGNTLALFNLINNSNSYDKIIIDVETYITEVDIQLGNRNLELVFTKPLHLAIDNSRLLRFNNKYTQGSLTLHNPELDGNNKYAGQDGGLLQINNVKVSKIFNLKLYNYKKHNKFNSNGIATTGINCITYLYKPEIYGCDSQAIYSQTSTTFIYKPYIHDSQSHGIAHVNCNNFVCLGGIITNCDRGILTYSTEKYRSMLNNMRIIGTSLRNNNVPFEVSRRFEENNVSGSLSNIYFKSVDFRNCRKNAIIGNKKTNNKDGFSIRGIYFENCEFDRPIDIYKAYKVTFTDCQGVEFRSNKTSKEISST